MSGKMVPSEATDSVNHFSEVSDGRQKQSCSEKISFFIYIGMILLSMAYGAVLLIWGALIRLYALEMWPVDLVTPFVEQVSEEERIKHALGFFGINLHEASWLFLVIVGLVVQLVLLAGFCSTGLSKEQREDATTLSENESCLSLCFMICLRVFMSTTFVLAGAAYALDHPLRSHMSSMMSAWREGRLATYVANNTFQMSMDIYQTVFQCCGADGPRDWISFDNTDGSYRIPSSCCRDLANCITFFPNDDARTYIEGTTASYNAQTTGTSTSSGWHIRGCNEAITSWLQLHALMLILTGLILLATQISWCVWRRAAQVSQLCFLLCNPKRKNGVQPIESGDNIGSATSESLVFLEKVPSSTHRFSAVPSSDEIHLNQIISKHSQAESSLYLESTPSNFEANAASGSQTKWRGERERATDSIPGARKYRNDTSSKTRFVAARKRGRRRSKSMEDLSGTTFENIFEESPIGSESRRAQNLQKPNRSRQKYAADDTIAEERGSTELEREESDTRVDAGELRQVWAAAVMKIPEAPSPAAEEDDLSIYSLESVEW